jgi:hypothetical protein
MDMWKGIEEAGFKKTDGGYLFFPYGILGTGYPVDEDKKAELAGFIRNLFIWSLPFVLYTVLFGSWLAAAILIPSLLAYYLCDINRRLAGVPRSNERG